MGGDLSPQSPLLAENPVCHWSSVRAKMPHPSLVNSILKVQDACFLLLFGFFLRLLLYSPGWSQTQALPASAILLGLHVSPLQAACSKLPTPALYQETRFFTMMTIK